MLAVRSCDLFIVHCLDSSGLPGPACGVFRGSLPYVLDNIVCPALWCPFSILSFVSTTHTMVAEVEHYQQHHWQW